MINGHNVHENVFLYKQYEGFFFETLGFFFVFFLQDYHHMFDMFSTRFTIHRRACLHPVVKAVEMM